MQGSFSSEFFTSNRARLRQLFTGTAPIVITAHGLLQKGADATFPFAQDASFWYLTGLDDPEVVLVLDKDKEYLILPERSAYQETFDGVTNTSTLTEKSGIATVLSAKDGWKQLGNRIKKVKHVATLAANPGYVDTFGMYTNPARAQVIQKMKDINTDIELLDLRQHLARLRMVKQPVELTVMQQAIDLTIDALKRAKKKLPKLQYEYEIEAEITGHFIRNGAVDAWKPIVASGANACVLHARDNRGVLRPEDVVVIDVGAEYHHYAADITRTYAVGSKLTKRHQAIFRAVLDVQEFAFALQKPGVLIRDNETEIEQFMGEKLRELGLIKTIDHETVRKYFPHATSHFLGIDPHDAGNYERPLEPGVVLTVEPGIYIPEEGIGVRIEDDVLITEKGHEVLSDRLPREL